tara:strand:- start:4377 stop:5465 length:1089 start_codon:yes stop_codon:yes gene_type:complete
MLIDLKNKYKNQKAIVIMGGPSILKNKLDLALLKNRSDIIFVEPKTLTKKFFEFGILPDYVFATYPEKLRTNTMQYTFIQAIASGYDLKDSLKKDFVPEWINFVNNFQEYAEIWRINYPHKKFKIKKNVILKNSPYDFIKSYPEIPIIAFEKALESDGYSYLNLSNKVYKFEISDEVVSKYENLQHYLNPTTKDNKVIVNSIDSLNSATIGMMPILNFLGFKQVCFIGKDMSMLGAMEYSGEYIFKSMRHYKSFHNSARKAFSYNFPKGFNRGILSFIKNIFLNNSNIKKGSSENKFLFKKFINDGWGLNGKFMREKNQFNDYELIGKNSNIKFINIYQPTKYAKPVPGMNNVDFKIFLDNH